MPLTSMKKSIKEQVKMNLNIVKILLSIYFLLQVGCTTLRPTLNSKNVLCDEEVNSKSLEYLEQQYRCTKGKY